MAPLIDPATANNISGGMGVAGSILAAAGQLSVGDAAMANAQYKAAQERINAGQVMASGQADMQAQIMQTKLLQSHALAVAGASGASTLDPTVVNIVAGVAKQGDYNTNMTQYNTTLKANALTNQANADVWSGQQAQAASKWAAFGTIMGGVQNATKAFGVP